MQRDRDLIFGLISVQHRQITPTQFVEAAAQWSEAMAEPLDAILLARGYMQAPERDFLLMVVNQIILAHDGDLKKALESIGGDEEIQTIISLGREEALSRTLSHQLGWVPEEMAADTRRAAALREAPDRYNDLGERGRGGMGRVLLVKDGYLGREIALKELLADPEIDGEGPAVTVTGGPAMNDRAAVFLHEARLTAKLEHPSIVPVYEVGRRENGTYYYTMRFIHGSTLREAIHEKNSLQERLGLLAHYVSLCQAIAYVHDRNILHRDIKPSNVMIGQYGETIVIDWGLAITLDGSVEVARETRKPAGKNEGNTSFGSSEGPVGTPYYMPPEQVSGDSSALDARSDVYALGAVLYEILTGKPPFHGTRGEKVLDEVLAGNIIPIRTRVPDVPPELALICEKAMRYSQADRYPSAMALANDIASYQTGALVGVYHYSLWELLRNYYRRHRAVVLASATSLLVILFVVAGAYYQILAAKDRETRERIAAEAARDDARAAQAIANAAQAREGAARAAAEWEAYTSKIQLAQQHAESADYAAARTVLASTQSDLRNWEWDYLMQRTYQGERVLEGHENTVRWLRFNPTGTLVLSIDLDHNIRVWDTESGDPLSAVKLGTEWVRGLHWAPNGRSYIVAAWNGQVYFFDGSTGRQERVFDAHDRGISASQLSEDGTLLATAGFYGELKLWDLPAMTLREAVETDIGSITRLEFGPDLNRLFLESAEGAVHVWNRAQQEMEFRIDGKYGDLTSDGTLLATFGQREFRVTHLDGTGASARWDAARETLDSLAFIGASEIVAVVARGEPLRLWNIQIGQVVFESETEFPIARMAANADASQLILMTNNGVGYLFDTIAEKVTREMRGHRLLVAAADLNDEGTALATSDYDGTLRIWNEVAPDTNHLALPGNSFVWHLQAHSPSHLMAVGDSSSMTHFIDTRSMALLHSVGIYRYGGHGAGRFSRDGRYYLVPADGFGVLIINMADFSLFRHHLYGQPVSDCLYVASEPPSVLMVGQNDAKRIDIESGELIQQYAVAVESVRCVAQSPNGKRFALGTGEGELLVFDVDHDQPLFQQAMVPTGLEAIVFVDDARVVVGDRVGNVFVVEVESGAIRIKLREHSLSVDTIVAVPDSDRFLTSTSDGLLIWSCNSDRSMATIPQKRNTGFSAALSNRELWIARGRDGIEIIPTQRQKIPAIGQAAAYGIDVYISSPDHQRATTLLLESFATLDTEEDTRALSSEAVRRLSRWCLLEGDQIVACDETPIANWKELAAHLTGEEGEKAREPGVLRLKRGDRDTELRFHMLESHQEERTVSVSRSGVVAFLEAELAMDNIARSITEQRSIQIGQGVGEDSKAAQLPGIAIGRPQSTEEWALYDVMQLEHGTLMTRMEGEMLTSLDTLDRACSQLLEGIASNTVNSFTIEYALGQFQTRTVRYQIAD